MQRYVTNFFVYWYRVEVPSAWRRLYKHLLYLLESTSTLPMATNLNKPLYQDDSPFGRNLGFVIRLVWVWVGGAATFVAIIPFFVYYLLYSLLPIIALLLIIYSLILAL